METLKKCVLLLLVSMSMLMSICQASVVKEMPSVIVEEEYSSVVREVVAGLGKYPLTPELAKLIAEEEAKWHWLPWHHVRAELVNNVYDIQRCKEPESSFPDDLFTIEQLRQGAIVLHFIAVIYGFTLLAVICNDYFIPSVECICEDLKLSKDVAAATFMASATSCPELFVNIMGTFITESDLGIGTIVGSALFNTLGVAAVGGLAAATAISIKRWPVTRDSTIYIFNVIILVVIVWDDRIYWYESLVLVVLYFCYFIFMFNNQKIALFILRLFKKEHLLNESAVEVEGVENDGFAIADKPQALDTPMTREADIQTRPVEVQIEKDLKSDMQLTNVPTEDTPEKIPKSLWRFPSEKSTGKKIYWVYTWPLKLILTCTVPSPKTFRFLYPLTFILCIIWIGINSYFVSWMITTIGLTFMIPDSIMGMTFLAMGGCLPEAFSILIMSRRGEGEMGVSNSLGANSLAILFSLGIPWFAKGLSLNAAGSEGYIELESAGMNYIIISIIFAVLFLYVILIFGNFELKKTVGACMIISYLLFATLAILTEAGVFFEIAVPDC